ncbi:hypothetical protein PC128_g11102 [Phytophthora cactorum]|nr:hypothetical protein PC120_g22415 [Phytophthora cactorum]KAG3069208.1 hypothetical protein PC121_g9895 [Phytophthora cactorum]KAG3191018.1 hypothetical protein PC128_g11102 [Phytophthora cactorum]KAG4041638.1 hypothetical protein PC123_g22856 [Phytophthora cactorum]
MAAALLAGTAAANNNTTTTSNTTTTVSGCWDVSVEHDATYCIEGPICSGSGLEPTGSHCPVKGDVATADCHDYLASYSGEGSSCVLPVDSTCQVIKTGAWGCVLSSSGSASDEGAVEAGSGSAAANVTVLAAAENVESSDGVSASLVAAIAVGAGCVAAVAGFALYKQYQKHSAEAAERAHLETFVDVVTP